MVNAVELGDMVWLPDMWEWVSERNGARLLVTKLHPNKSFKARFTNSYLDDLYGELTDELDQVEPLPRSDRPQT